MPSPFVPGEVILKSAQRLDAMRLRGLGVRAMRRLDAPPAMAKAMGGDLYCVRLADGVSVQDGMARLARERGVAWAEPNWRVHELDEGSASAAALQAGGNPKAVDPPAAGMPNPQAWGLSAIHAPEAWAITTGRTQAEGGPLIATVDTGLDYTHPDLAANVYVNPAEIPGDGIDNDGNGIVDDVHGADFAYHDGDPMDVRGHGTHVGGTIAGSGVGVNWHASLMPLKFLDDDGFGDTANAIQALMYAERAGARVTSNSWGGINYSQALYETLRASHALHICAAGNDASDNDVTPAYPASYDLDNVLSVAATQRDDTLASFSNFGVSSVDVAAPGHEVWSTLPGNGHGLKSGTSMAAPHVTGAAALVLSQFPALTNAQVKERLIDSVDPVPALEGTSVSGGRINVARALSEDTTPPAPIGDLAATAVGPDRVNLSWTASGDDGTAGSAARYELRTADRPIVAGPAAAGQISWDDARPIRLPRPAAAGATEHAAVDVLPEAVDHDRWFALVARDKVGNPSPPALARARVPGTPLAFRDDIENGLGQWQANGTWAVVADGGNHVVTDSPDGDYPPDVDSTLTSRPIDLAGLSHPVLEYKTRFKVESIFDRLAVEISADGATWNEIDLLAGRGAEGQGTSAGWIARRCDLASYAGKTIQLRVHLKSDADVEMDGVSLDDFIVRDASPGVALQIVVPKESAEQTG